MANVLKSAIQSIDYMANYSRGNDFESLECPGTEDHYRYDQLQLIPAVIIIIVYSFTIRRKNKYLDTMGGRPGLFYPVSMLTHSERLSYAASFGVISSLIFKMVFESRQAIEYDGNDIVRALISIVSTLIYGVNCFPIIASVTMKTALGYGVGTLYMWAFTILCLYFNSDCNKSQTVNTVYNIMNIPQFICMVYLAFRFPYSFLMEIQRWRKERQWQRGKSRQTFHQLRGSHQGRTVTNMVKPIRKPNDANNDTIEAKVNSCLTRVRKEYFYEWDDNFKYSTRILTTMWVCFILIYMSTIKAVWTASSFFFYMTDYANYALDGIGRSNQPGDSSVEKLARTFLKLYYYAFGALWILLIFCFSVSFIIGVLSILYSLSAYRQNMKALYRGDHSQIRPITCKTNTGHLTGSIRYTGYQVGYMAWGFLIQSLCIVVFVIVAVIVIVVLFLGLSEWLTSALAYLVPWLLVFILILISEYFLSRYVFLQNYEQSLAIDNRRALYIFAYFLFFYNAFVGIGSCLLRLSRSLITGILLIARLDQSILPRKYELKDSGYGRYLGFLHVEAYHNHPCLLVFIDLLKLSNRETRARMILGPLYDVKEKWMTKRRKPGTLAQDMIMSIFLQKKHSRDSNSSPNPNPNPITKKNQIDVSSLELDSVAAKRESSADENSDQDLPPLTSKEKIQQSLTLASAGPDGDVFSHSQTKRTRCPPLDEARDAVVQIDEPASKQTHGDSWDIIRESPQMKRYRRKQNAVSNWFLAYTLLANPQLRYLRKGFLQKRMRDANAGIATKMTDSVV